MPAPSASNRPFVQVFLLRALAAFMLFLLVLVLANPGRAATIASLDLTKLTFRIDMEKLTGTGLVTGVSNGIAFTLDVRAYDATRSTLDDDHAYNDLPKTYDSISLWRNFTLTFAEPVAAVLFALSKTSGQPDGPDLGFVPTDSRNITLNGTQLLIADNGGALAYQEFATPVTQITQTDRGRKDALSFTFFAFRPQVAPVPLPAPVGMLGAAVGALALLRRRSEARAG